MALLGAAIASMLPAVPAAASSASSDRAEIAQLEQRAAQQGVSLQSVVARYDEALGGLSALRASLASAKVKLAADERAEAAEKRRLQKVAVYEYTTSGTSPSSNARTLPVSKLNAMAVTSEYLDVAVGDLKEILSTYRQDQRATRASAQRIRKEQAEETATLGTLSGERSAILAAMASEQATLAQLKANLAAVLAAIATQQAAEERAAEQALARRQAAEAAEKASALPPAPPPPSAVGASSGYANPLRAISGLSPERIDQGVDYRGYGPIYAIGDGVVLNTVNSGWPGGTFISYKLTSGPASGLVVYAAEDIYPVVQVGQEVTSSTVLGTMYEGPDGIETGWADSSGEGYTMAHDYGQFNGSNSTAFGYNFSQLLQYLGAPGGVLQNNPPTGSLPPGWPAW